MIPAAAPRQRIERFLPLVQQQLQKVLRSDQYVLGSEVESFERDFASYIGAQHCIAVNSCTDAIGLALRSLDIGEGDQVLTVSMTAAGTAMPILHTGAEPRFVDIDFDTRCMDVDQVEAAITPRTKAIIPVHLHGLAVDMPRLMAIAQQHEIVVIEDCAQAHGCRLDERVVGSFGRLGVFSFYPTKNLGCIGDGGAIVTSDDALASRLRELRNYGWPCGGRVSKETGYNSRLDELQAAILGALLPHLDESNRERAEIASQYRELLTHEKLDLPRDHAGAVYHQFAIAAESRDQLRAYLHDHAGIATGIHYATPLHQQPAFARFALTPLPVTEDLARRFVSLPIQPEVVGDDVSNIAQAVIRGLQSCKV